MKDLQQRYKVGAKVQMEIGNKEQVVYHSYV